ncbi:MAG: glycosyltransferase family 2 protein [Candidatus Omnitrophota bacterium]
MIYVLLPAYNEAKNIKALVSKIKEVLTKEREKFCIVIVNDGSTDNTQEILRETALNMPELKVINFAQNKGVGAVFREGIDHICSLAKDIDVIISLDCDLSHSPDAFPGVIKAIKAGNDIVVASRYHRMSSTVDLPFKREFLSNSINLLLKVIFPIPGVKDYTTFFRAYRVRILKKAKEFYQDRFIRQKGFPAMAEILIKLRRFKPKADEVAMSLRFDLRTGESKMNKLETVIDYLKLIARCAFRK